MNTEEILAMKADEELDRLVATEVMGEPIPEFIPPNAIDLQLVGSPVKSPQGNWLSRCKYSEGDIPTWRPLPFSTDILAAWQVMRKMVDSDDSWDFAYHLTEVIQIPIHKHSIPDVIEHLLIKLNPEAICKAALLAKLGV